MKLHGIPVTLYERTPTGLDRFNRPTYAETPVVVENVLVAPAADTEIPTATDPQGRKAVYTIAIPKGDCHVWEGRRVRFFDADWQVIGLPQRGIDDLIPLDWNEKWLVARYE